MRVLAIVLLCGCGRLGFDNPDALNNDGALGNSDAMIDLDAASGACGTNVLLFDDFEDGVPASEWTTLAGNGLTVAETGGVLQITFSSNVPAGQTAGYKSTALNFTNTCVEAEVVMPANQGSGAVVEFQLGAGQNRAFFNVFNGMIVTEEQRGAAVYRGPTIAFDPVADRWLRMREVGGTWYFQAAPDGIAYTTLFAEPMEFPLQNQAALTVAAGSGSAVGNGGIAQFGSVRVTGP